MIDGLGLPKRQVNSLEALHARVNVRGQEVPVLSSAQRTALQAACTATIAAGKATPEFLMHAKNLGLNCNIA